MDTFPPEIDADKIFVAPPENPELAQIREYIAACIADCIKSRQGFVNVQIEGQQRTFVTRPPIRISLNSRLRGHVPMNYRNLLAIHTELIARNFIIQYENSVWHGPMGGMTSKQISFEELDPFGSLPDAMILSGKAHNLKK